MSAYRSFLLEVGTEELPVWAVEQALHQLDRTFRTFFESSRLPFRSLRVLGTPRRLAVLADVAPEQEAWEEKVQGPPLHVARKGDAWTPAAEGFVRKLGVPLDALQVEERGKGVYVVAVVRRGGKTARELLEEGIPDLLASLEFPKTMRWNGEGVRFPRPIRWLVALLDDEVLNLSFAGLSAGRKSRGHRFIRPYLEIPHAREYEHLLEEAGVVVDPERRKNRLARRMDELARIRGVERIEDQELLLENTHLLEHPESVMGEFDPAFLDLPDVVILTALKQHQRYFGARTPEGNLASVFLAPMNMPADRADEVREGVERVVRARLEDARFYFEEDLKIPLKDRIPMLKGVFWVERLGTLYDKTERLVKLSLWIAERVGADRAVVEEGAWLAKVDQTTLMIRDGKEFTKLEGRIGMEYALRQGYPEPVARVIYEHHLPKDETFPSSLEGAVVGLADRVDTLVGFFAMGERVKGSRDPFGLRRDASAAFDLILRFSMNLNFKELLAESARLYPDDLDTARALPDLEAFLMDRFEHHLEDREGIRYDIVDAVMALGNWNLVDVHDRARALQGLLERDEDRFTGVVVGLKRVNNILKGVEVSGDPDPARFEEEAERALWEALPGVDRVLEEALEAGDYPRTLEALFSLRPLIDRFFDTVFVMVEDEDIRMNRLRLLRAVRDRFERYADLSRIVVQG